MIQRPSLFAAATVAATFLLLPAPGQRTRTLAASSSISVLPVTAHRQVAWASGGTVYLWDGSAVASFATGGTVNGVGFVGASRLFCTVQGGPSYGYNVWDVGAGTWTRLLTNPVDAFHTDGDAAVFPLPGYAGFGLYTGGASFTSYPFAAGSAYQPQVHGRYVAYQRRTGTGYTDYNVYRYDRTTGATLNVSTTTSGGTDARVDQAGRVLYLAGALTSYARVWWNDLASAPRPVVDLGYGGLAYRYDAHLGQLAYSRRQASGSGPFDLWLEDARTARPVDTTIDGHAELQLRGGMAAWISGGMRVFDGQSTLTLSPYQNNLPRNGSALDRGWIVTGSGGGPVVLRESRLTWDRDTLPVASGGVVRLDLIAGTANAGRQYLVLASLSGSYPGTPLGSVTMPLVYDGFAAASVALLNSPIFADTFGVLDAAGNATARFVLPAGIAGALTGEHLTFAYVLLTPAIDFASNPARVQLVP